jgi:phenylacetate-CoA ligase
MVVVRGVNVYPSALENIVRACGGVAEYCVEIRTSSALTELCLRIEPAPEHQAEAAALAKRLESSLHSVLGLRISVSTVDQGTLPRFEMKAQRWIRR